MSINFKVILLSICLISFITPTQNFEIDNSVIIDKILNSFKNHPVEELFKVWHLLYKKSYILSSLEAKSRLLIFKENLKFINQSNSENKSFTLGLNQFSDLTFEEFLKSYTDSSLLLKINELQYEKVAEMERLIIAGEYVPSNNLTEKNLKLDIVDHSVYLPPIRSQGPCGSCWAFATAASIEGNRRKKNQTNADWVSTQQFIDCDLKDGGCNGGWPLNALSWAKTAKIVSDLSYPYKALRETCKAVDNFKELVKVIDFEICNRNCANHHDLLIKGPIVSAIEANRDFMSYRSGILNSPCSKNVNKSITIIGFGIENNVEFYKVRNTWGKGWGDLGNFRIKRNVANNNTCGLGAYAFRAVTEEVAK